MLTHHQIITFVLLTICSSKLEIIEANVLFHFGLDFTVKNAESDASSAETQQHQFNKTIEVVNNQINVIDNNTGEHEKPESLDIVTSSPIADINELRSQQTQLNEAIIAKIASTREAIELVNRDLYPLVGRSDYIAAKVKLTTRYLNALNPIKEQQKPKLEILEQFVSLVDELKVPPTIERAVDFVVIKLLLEKNGILELQENIRHMNAEVRKAREVWQSYIKSKLIEVPV